MTNSGAHWGRCLRVRVNIDVSKRLVRGKKLAIEGDTQRWIFFKYERFPNLCYKCGLLNQDLKECLELAPKEQLDLKNLQYGLWLRGDIIQRMTRDTIKPDRKGMLETNKSTVEEQGNLLAVTAQSKRGIDEPGKMEISNSSYLGIGTTGCETDKTRKEKEDAEVYHVRRKVNNQGNSLETILPILVKDSVTEEET